MKSRANLSGKKTILTMDLRTRQYIRTLTHIRNNTFSPAKKIAAMQFQAHATSAAEAPGFTGLKPSSGEPALDLHGHARQPVANMKLEPQPANDKVSYPTSARAQKSQLPECHLHEIKEVAPHFQIFELKNWRQPSIFFVFRGYFL